VKAATISTLPDVATKDSRLSNKNNLASADQDDLKSSGPTNIILPSKLKGGKQVLVKTCNDQSLNTSLTQIEGSDPGTLMREQEQQQMMQHHASLAA